MQVYGNVNKYVINMLGKAVIVEDTEKRTLNFLPEGVITRFWSNPEVGRKRDGLGRLHVEDL
jgi:hypothetical protein